LSLGQCFAFGRDATFPNQFGQDDEVVGPHLVEREVVVAHATVCCGRRFAVGVTAG